MSGSLNAQIRLRRFRRARSRHAFKRPRTRTKYGYDNANELMGLTYKQGATAVGGLIYAYDNAGNLANRSGTLDVTSLPAALTSTSFDADNRLTHWGTATLTYDLNGNMSGDGTQTYTWNTRDQLIGASGTHTASFVYDGLGRRITKTIDGTARALAD